MSKIRALDQRRARRQLSLEERFVVPDIYDPRSPNEWFARISLESTCREYWLSRGRQRQVSLCIVFGTTFQGFQHVY